MAGDLPSISNSNYTNTAYDGSGTSMGYVDTTGETTAFRRFKDTFVIPSNAVQSIGVAGPVQFQQQKGNIVAEQKRRIVKVIVIDPDNKVPLDKCTLYSGVEKLTDLTDQELFFEIDIKKALDEHNKLREATVDKSVKERTEHLEPIKIRDLRMVVVTVAQF